jgi:hypothetical protein
MHLYAGMSVGILIATKELVQYTDNMLVYYPGYLFMWLDRTPVIMSDEMYSSMRSNNNICRQVDAKILFIDDHTTQEQLDGIHMVIRITAQPMHGHAHIKIIREHVVEFIKHLQPLMHDELLSVSDKLKADIQQSRCIMEQCVPSKHVYVPTEYKIRVSDEIYIQSVDAFNQTFELVRRDLRNLELLSSVVDDKSTYTDDRAYVVGTSYVYTGSNYVPACDVDSRIDTNREIYVVVGAMHTTTGHVYSMNAQLFVMRNRRNHRWVRARELCMSDKLICVLDQDIDAIQYRCSYACETYAEALRCQMANFRAGYGVAVDDTLDTYIMTFEQSIEVTEKYAYIPIRKLSRTKLLASDQGISHDYTNVENITVRCIDIPIAVNGMLDRLNTSNSPTSVKLDQAIVHIYVDEGYIDLRVHVESCRDDIKLYYTIFLYIVGHAIDKRPRDIYFYSGSIFASLSGNLIKGTLLCIGARQHPLAYTSNDFAILT